MNDQLSTLLENYGLTKNQASIYLTCLACGTAPAASIARRAQVNRTSCYQTLQELEKQWLLFQIERNSVKHFYALDPESLGEKLKERYEHFQKQLPALLQLATAGSYKPSIKFYDGKQAVSDFLFKEHAKRQESMDEYDMTRRGFQDHQFPEHYRDRLEYAGEKYKEHEKVHLLSNESKVEKELIGIIHDREIKTEHPFKHFDRCIRVCGDYIILLAIQETHHFAYELHDPSFSATLRELFQFVWEKV